MILIKKSDLLPVNFCDHLLSGGEFCIPNECIKNY